MPALWLCVLQQDSSTGVRRSPNVRHASRLLRCFGADLAAEDAILRQARLGGFNLIVMGVARRPGENLLFGNVATAIMESADRSILFVAT